MASFTNLLVIAFIIEVTLVTLGLTTIPGSSLYVFITNPTDFDSSNFWSLIQLTVDGVTLGAVVVGLVLFKTDFIVFAVLAGTLFSFGKGVGNLYIQISNIFGNIVAMFFVSPIVLVYVMLAIAWWRGRVD